ncbi:RHS repeat-associated core domain-containing protein [Clostridium sp. NSJ-27]|uniref:RHS repeat-associated core domain-containing protein n=2 Tax=Clostridium facile TaxID=2763035 RepID=A0ABR7IQX9_9CLOT|nr:RHS repeat-associated core domain-containing protein [Clostridium facile]
MGQLNPFRYRGYYYDTESGLYYLQNRYYDPLVKRFINCDTIAGNTGAIDSHNTYSYCKNNPINNTDTNGQSCFKFLMKVVTKYIARPIVNAIKSVAKKQSWTKSFGGSISGAIGPFIGNVTAGLVMDSQGRIGYQKGVSGGFSNQRSARSVSAGFYSSSSNVPDIRHEIEESYLLGGSATVPIPAEPPIPITIGMDGTIQVDREGNTFLGESTNVGISYPPTLSSEAHVMWSESDTQYLFNIYEELDKYYTMIEEW